MYKIIGLFSVLMFGVFWALSGKFYINTTPSLPYGVWQKIDSNGFKVGDYIVFCPTKTQLEFYPKDKNYPSGMCENNVAPMFKQIYSGKDSRFFVIGKHPKSFDSRHFGDVSESQIIATVKPLFTWKG